MTEDDFTRGLTTIVAMDIAGYSRLMGVDEAGTLSRLKAYRAVIDPINIAHGGRPVGTAGDGLLLEFPSVVDAVTCAVSVQAELAARNAGLADDERMLFRVGINLGDGDDVFGDGVNIAARLKALAEPGGICISQSVRDSIRDRMPIALDDMGEIEVKNVARPVEVYRVLGESETPSETAAAAPIPGAIKNPRAALIGAAVAFLILAGAGWYVNSFLTGGR